MKIINYTFSFIFFSLLFLSCERNIDQIDVINIVEEPDLLSTTIIAGKVTDVEGNGIPLADIFIYHTKLTHHIKANEHGEYLIAFPKDDERIQLKAGAQNFLDSSFDIIYLDQENKTKDFTLAMDEDLPYDVTNTFVITDSLYQIRGQVLYSDGSPHAGTLIYLFEQEDDFLFSYSITDEAGNYSFAYGPFDQRFIMVQNECGEVEIIDDISIQNQDIDMGTFTSSIDQPTYINVSGTVTDCNSNLLGLGEVTISIPGSSATTMVENGSFDVQLLNCAGVECYNIQITSLDLTDSEIYHECLTITEDQSISEFVLCDETAEFSGEITLQYGSENLIFQLNSVQSIGSFSEITIKGINPELDETIEFNLGGVGIENAPVDYFNYSQMGSTILEHLENAGMISNYTADNDTIIGSFEGPTMDVNNSSVLVSGTFLIIEE